jgi:hypothetical protein
LGKADIIRGRLTADQFHRNLLQENDMGTQEYRANYRAAFHVANSDLNEIYREFEQLQLRKEMIESVVSALEPFLHSSAEGSHESFHAEVSHEAYRAEVSHETFQSAPVPTEEPKAEVLVPVASEPQYTEGTPPAAFPPKPEIIVDALQNRINRALGLAVA